MATRQPTPQTRRFGAEVTRLRTEAKLTRLELANRVAVTRSYIAQVENGTTRCRRDFAERLDNGLGTGTALVDAWDDLLHSAGYPKWYADFPRAESSAALLRTNSETFVAGLLQTKDYARALLASETALDGRLRRQQVLSRNPPPELVIILAESVLAREVGGPEVMRAQCEYLLEVSQWENVTLQVAPTAHYRGISGTFSIATQANGDEMVIQDISTGAVTSSEPSDIVHLVSAFAAMQARCLSVDESRDFIRRAITRWTA